MIIVLRIIHVKVDRRLNVTNKFKYQRRLSSRLTIVMFRGTPCMCKIHDIYQLSAPCTEYPRCRYSYSLRTYNCTFTEYSGLTTCTKYSGRCTLYRSNRLYRIFRTYNMYTVQESKYVQDNVYIVHCTGSKTFTERKGTRIIFILILGNTGRLYNIENSLLP